VATLEAAKVEFETSGNGLAWAKLSEMEQSDEAAN
jgi:hypothetical protein